MLTLSRKQEIFKLKWLLFPYWLSNFFENKNWVEAIDKIEKLCKFHENRTKNVDFIAYIKKRLMDRRMDDRNHAMT